MEQCSLEAVIGLPGSGSDSPASEMIMLSAASYAAQRYLHDEAFAAAPDRVGAAWVDAYRAVRAETEARAAPLAPEDQAVQSMPDASPTKWHRAHTTWFFEQFVLAPSARRYRPFDARFGYLFNSYYVAAGPRHARP